MTTREHRNVAQHILPTAATMVGVCMTVISIAKLSQATPMRHLADRLLGLDALLFLGSVILSHASIRTARLEGRLEAYADAVFLAGSALMAITGVIVAFEMF